MARRTGTGMPGPAQVARQCASLSEDLPNLRDLMLSDRLFDVIATTNLNGDYLSDALAAQVGGIGIAPGGNIVS